MGRIAQRYTRYLNQCARPWVEYAKRRQLMQKRGSYRANYRTRRLHSGWLQYWQGATEYPLLCSWEALGFTLAHQLSHPCALVLSATLDHEFEHSFRHVHDWAGDPGVIGGTHDIDYLECEICGIKVAGRFYYEEEV